MALSVRPNLCDNLLQTFQVSLYLDRDTGFAMVGIEWCFAWNFALSDASGSQLNGHGEPLITEAVSKAFAGLFMVHTFPLNPDRGLLDRHRRFHSAGSHKHAGVRAVWSFDLELISVSRGWLADVAAVAFHEERAHQVVIHRHTGRVHPFVVCREELDANQSHRLKVSVDGPRDGAFDDGQIQGVSAFATNMDEHRVARGEPPASHLDRNEVPRDSRVQRHGFRRRHLACGRCFRQSTADNGQTQSGDPRQESGSPFNPRNARRFHGNLPFRDARPRKP